MPMSDYRRRELALLESLAWSTINDPKASPDDRRDARLRLEDGGELDLGRLTSDEADVLSHLLARAAGIEVSMVDDVALEYGARSVAERARARVAAETSRLERVIAASEQPA